MNRIKQKIKKWKNSIIRKRRIKKWKIKRKERKKKEIIRVAACVVKNNKISGAIRGKEGSGSTEVDRPEFAQNTSKIILR
jgi:hypothetical protein